MREVKAAARKQEAENAKQRERQEDITERIERITWEHGENPKKPTTINKLTKLKFKGAICIRSSTEPAPPVTTIMFLFFDI